MKLFEVTKPFLILFVLAISASAQVSYVASDVPVTIACTAKLSVPAVQDINQDTGKPDPRLPLVDSASWTVLDKNGNPAADISVNATKMAAVKIDNAAILTRLVKDGVIPQIKGYALTATPDFNSDGASFVCHVVGRGDYFDVPMSLSISSDNIQKNYSDVTNYTPAGDVKSIVHKGSSTFETTASCEFLDGSANGIAIGAASDVSWLSDPLDPSSLSYVSVPSKFVFTAISGSYSTQDAQGNSIPVVIQGSIGFGAAKAIKMQ
jgi:hypothetical protein